MSDGRSNDAGGEDAEEPDWYAERLDELLAKPVDEVSRELPGLADRLAELARETDDTRAFRVGVSFANTGSCLDYTIRRVVEPDGYVETVKEPVSDRHRYVSFTHPPDPHVDPGAIRGRLVAAVDRARRDRREGPTTGLADVWDEL